VLRRVLGENPANTVSSSRFPAEDINLSPKCGRPKTTIVKVYNFPPRVNKQNSGRPKFRFVLAIAGRCAFNCRIRRRDHLLGRPVELTAKRQKARNDRDPAPFARSLSEKSRRSGLELGMADTLISRMGNSRDVIVRPLSSVRGFGSLDQDAVAARNGSRRRISPRRQAYSALATRIRVNVRFVNVAGRARCVWTDTFDEKFTDIFVVQDSISTRVSNALSLPTEAGKGKRA